MYYCKCGAKFTDKQRLLQHIYLMQPTRISIRQQQNPAIIKEREEEYLKLYNEWKEQHHELYSRS
jgi:hypothetical protein